MCPISSPQKSRKTFHPDYKNWRASKHLTSSIFWCTIISEHPNKNSQKFGNFFLKEWRKCKKILPFVFFLSPQCKNLLPKKKVLNSTWHFNNSKLKFLEHEMICHFERTELVLITSRAKQGSRIWQVVSWQLLEWPPIHNNSMVMM
jgi:hypothetical protein